MSSFIEEYSRYCEKHGKPERLELMLCDLNGILRGKWLPEESVGKLAKGEVRLPISTCAPNILGEEVTETGLGIVAGDPDGVLHAVHGSLYPVPWVEGNVAQVLVEMTDLDGNSLEVSAREMLRSMLKKFEHRGLFPVVATELEFYIFQKRDDVREAPTPPERSPQAQNYDLEVLSRQQDILDDILAAAEQQGLETDALIAEFGAGQFEINFHHTKDVMRAAETALMFKRLVRGVVQSHGMEASFMAKPYADMPGNGMHVHASLTDKDGQNVFDESGDIASDLLKDAVAGLLETMPDLQAIFAPHFNSYRRFQSNSFAPSSPDWGYDNRSAGVRIPETKGKGARFEHRICGADVNPYLAIAAILGSVLYGLDNKPNLPEAIDNSDAELSQPLGSDWLTSVRKFAQSEIAADIFGKTYRDLYAGVRMDEIGRLTTIISPMEYEYYLSRF